MLTKWNGGRPRHGSNSWSWDREEKPLFAMNDVVKNHTHDLSLKICFRKRKNAFAESVLRAAKLDARFYEEVESDRGAIKEGLAVIILSGIAGGAGTWIPSSGFAGLLWGMLAAILGWIVWAFATYFIAVKVVAGPMSYSNTGELLRGIAFASAPGLIRILGVFPPLREIVFILALVWMLAAMVIAVRQALDYSSTAEAFFVCVIGWFVHIPVVLVILRIKGLIHL